MEWSSRMKHRLAEIAERFGGHVLGNADTTIEQIATLESAQAEHITFLASSKYRTQLAATRAGHWNLDLYAVARQRIQAAGVRNIFGGAFCTYTDRERFFSYRRDRDARRMAAAIWLT